MDPSDAFVSTRASLMVNQTAATVRNLNFTEGLSFAFSVSNFVDFDYFMSNCFCSKWFDCTEYL